MTTTWKVAAGRLLGPFSKRLLPLRLRRLLLAKWEGRSGPAVGWVRFGSLRRTRPISRAFGFDRGTPIDRYYIEGFLRRYADDIYGHVLEIGDDSYTRRFGSQRVMVSDVFHVDDSNPAATITGDLANAPHIPSDTFDCILLTQTLQLIYDVRPAVATLRRILKPGGTALVTVPGISHLDRDWSSTWHWSFTPHSARRLFGECFPPENVTVEAHGNVLSTISFLEGLAAEELKPAELDEQDPSYPMLIAVRATKETVAR